MLIAQNEITSGSKIDFDLCIVSAGACGIAMARTFDHSDLKVALVESGGFEYSARS